MNERLWKTAVVLTGAGVLILLIFGLRFSLGWLLGCVVSVLLYKRNDSFWSSVLDTGEAGRGTGFLHFLVNYGMMAGALLVSAFFPEYLNIFACAAGMMLIKLTTVADVMIHH